MKITKQQLKELIKEELETVLNEKWEASKMKAPAGWTGDVDAARKRAEEEHEFQTGMAQDPAAKKGIMSVGPSRAAEIEKAFIPGAEEEGLPVANAMTSKYDLQRDLGKGPSAHKGTDVRAAVDTPVVGTTDRGTKVTGTGYEPRGGNWVKTSTPRAIPGSDQAAFTPGYGQRRAAELASAERTSMGPGGGTQIDLDMMRDQFGQRIGPKGQPLGDAGTWAPGHGARHPRAREVADFNQKIDAFMDSDDFDPDKINVVRDLGQGSKTQTVRHLKDQPTAAKGRTFKKGEEYARTGKTGPPGTVAHAHIETGDEDDPTSEEGSRDLELDYFLAGMPATGRKGYDPDTIAKGNAIIAQRAEEKAAAEKAAAEKASAVASATPQRRPRIRTDATVADVIAAADKQKALAAATPSYEVEEGDSLSKIASLYKDRGITIQDIIKANNIEDPNKIEIGQELKIPARPVGKRDDDEGIPTPGRNLAEAWGFNMDLSKLNE